VAHHTPMYQQKNINNNPTVKKVLVKLYEGRTNQPITISEQLELCHLYSQRAWILQCNLHKYSSRWDSIPFPTHKRWPRFASFYNYEHCTVITERTDPRILIKSKFWYPLHLENRFSHGCMFAALLPLQANLFIPKRGLITKLFFQLFI
jgi:hypothetical protein